MPLHVQLPNLLLIGPDAVISECLDRLLASVPGPVLFGDGAGPDFTTDPVRSVIVRDIDRLSQADQERLVEWLNRRDGETRVIATAARPVFPQVEQGEFSAALYYRINTVTLVLSERADMRWVGNAQRPTFGERGAPRVI